MALSAANASSSQTRRHLRSTGFFTLWDVLAYPTIKMDG
jgi:hypothetical protein